MAAPAVLAQGWGWRHPGRRDWAIRGLDLRIEFGERILLLGASGSGKSTLLAALAGISHGGGGESEGELWVAGLKPEAARTHTALLFQDPETQLVAARVGAELSFGLENRCLPAALVRERAAAALAKSGLAVDWLHPTSSLSGGQQQRLALAAVLATEPSLLLLDEPTAHLDAAGAREFRQALAALPEKATLLLVEHRIEDSLDLIDRVVVLDARRGIVADGSPSTVFGHDAELLASAGIWTHQLKSPERGPPRTPGGPCLSGEGLAFSYPGSKREAVSGIDVELRAGEALALRGANGSGKSTLALLLGGLLPPSRGTARLAPALASSGEDSVWRLPARDLPTRIGSVFQDPDHQFVRSRVDQELEVGPLQAGLGELAARARAQELSERLGLTALAAANPFSLSGGEKRRLSVATALAASPQVLVLDEPTFGQDRRGFENTLELVGGFADQGGAVCIASHDESFIARVSDREIVLDGGRLR